MGQYQEALAQGSYASARSVELLSSPLFDFSFPVVSDYTLEEILMQHSIANLEAVYEDKSQTTMEVPNELVPAVRELLAKHTKK